MSNFTRVFKIFKPDVVGTYFHYFSALSYIRIFLPYMSLGVEPLGTWYEHHFFVITKRTDFVSDSFKHVAINITNNNQRFCLFGK